MTSHFAHRTVVFLVVTDFIKMVRLGSGRKSGPGSVVSPGPGRSSNYRSLIINLQEKDLSHFALRPIIIPSECQLHITRRTEAIDKRFARDYCRRLQTQPCQTIARGKSLTCKTLIHVPFMQVQGV